MRKLVATLVGVTLLFPALTTDTIHAADTPAQQAAKEIADARDRANTAADELFKAESTLDVLVLDQQALLDQVAALEARIAKLRAMVEAVAINRYTRSGSSGLPLLTGFRAADEQAQIDVLINVVNETSADNFDEYESLNKDLAGKKDELVQNQVDAQAARDRLDQKRKDALAEVETLKSVEAERLQDEAVQKALEAEQADRRRQDDAKAKADAEALRSANNAGQGASNKSQQPTDTLVGGSSNDDDIDSSAGVKATGGSGGGQTGTVGVGGQPGSSPGDLGFDGWLCPVQGAVGFGDTWGAPRSGGRTHLGVDMIGASGLPVVAVVDGFAQSKVNTLGGNTITLSGADGNKYYYAHLSGWATLGSVAAGTVIGYVGQTGNAMFSVPHLHFEIHPGGGAAVNPYPTVRAHC
jgi:murein DD-endopeptidase MepM/ murein hydrolase activator NlpD